MMSDAIHSLSDTSSDIITLWALRMGRKHPTHEHPYGYGKFESLGSLSVGAVMALSALGMGWHSIEIFLSTLSLSLSSPLSLDIFHMTMERGGGGAESGLLTMSEGGVSGSEGTLQDQSLLNHHHQHGGGGGPTSIALVAALISIVSKEILYQLSILIGRRHHSSVVIANAAHHRSDALSSVVALVGIGASMYSGLAYADAMAGVVVSGMVLGSSWTIVRDSIWDLTDKKVCESILTPCRDVVMSIPDVRFIRRMRARAMGPFLTMDVDIALSPELSLSYAHLIAEHVRLKLMEANERIKDVVVHVDPDDEFHLPLSSHSHEDHRHDPSHVEQVLKMRSHSEIESNVKQVIEELCPEIQRLTHIRAYYQENRLDLQIEGSMSPLLTVAQAHVVADDLRKKVKERLSYVNDVDFHLEFISEVEDNQKEPSSPSSRSS